VGRAAARSERELTTSWLRVALEGGVEAGAVGGTFLLLLRLLVFSELALLVVWISPSRHSMLARLATSAVWIALKWPAYPFVGERSLRPGFDAGVVALGLVAHFACTTVWGLLFGFAALERSPRATIGLGLVWGVFGALSEVWTLSRVLDGALLLNPAFALAFLAYGYVLARTFLRFERKRTH
jgi:hypothetical protein